MLQRIKAQSEYLKHDRQAQAYKSQDKIAEYKVEEADAAASKAEADLYQWRIDHAVIKAPYDGEILKSNGDLSAAHDTPVKEGEEKLIYGYPDRLRAEMTVNERDIQDVTQGFSGRLATTSKPMSKYKFTVARVTPLGQPKEGSNVFTVYGDIADSSPSWRPGMAGEAQIDVGKRTWAWIWTHRLVDFVRLKTWL